MKWSKVLLAGGSLCFLLAGCTTTDSELTQKEKDKIARDMERANRKEAQAQSKMMRDTGQKRTSR